MTRQTRRLIFYALISIFVLVTPATILYATGFTFDWQKVALVKTGGFYFKSLPKGAKIFIDGELKDTTPTLIGHLVPRRYLVEVSKDGFHPWKKNLAIQSQFVTEARNILLVPKNPRLSLVSEQATSTQDYFLTEEQKNILAQASTTATSTLKDIASWTVFENNIYYLQKSNTILYKTNLNGSSKEQISFQPLPESHKLYQIKISKEQVAVFEPGGKLYLLDPEVKIFQSLTDDVQGIEFSPDNKKLLYWTDHEIWIFFLKDILAQPNKKQGQKDLINRYANKITQTTWLSETNEHIVFVIKEDSGIDKIKLTELDGRDLRNTYDVFSGKNLEIYFNDKDGLLYILMQKRLYSLDLFAD